MFCVSKMDRMLQIETLTKAKSNIGNQKKSTIIYEWTDLCKKSIRNKDKLKQGIRNQKNVGNRLSFNICLIKFPTINMIKETKGDHFSCHMTICWLWNKIYDMLFAFNRKNAMSYLLCKNSNFVCEFLHYFYIIICFKNKSFGISDLASCLF